MVKLILPYLEEMIRTNASDLFLTVGCPPALRVDGRVNYLPSDNLTNKNMETVLQDVLMHEQQMEFAKELEVNTAFWALEHRFRINFFCQMENIGCVIRMIRSTIPRFDELGLPSAYKRFMLERRGLILMVGATGSGKSTSMAAMIDYRNENSEGHIITLEDPIEFVYEHKKSIVTQREIGIDTHSYHNALKNALRQSPDVLVVGEIRDRETLESAIQFSETGHLVLATLHASSASQAIERVMNLYPEEMQRYVLFSLAHNIRSIISQRLIEAANGKRALAYEIMVNAGAIQQYIQEGRIDEVKELMEKSNDDEMITFDQTLYNLYQEKKISKEVALAEADQPNNLRLRLMQQSM